MAIDTGIGSFHSAPIGNLTKPKPVLFNAASAPISIQRPNPEPLSPSPLFASALKSSILFGAKKLNTADKPVEKLTYAHEKTIHDPVIGDIQVYRYSNGMELYAIKKDDVPLVSYGVLVKTGASNETRRTNGASHFLEHLIFKGTELLKPGMADQILESTGGQLNAFTSYDETFYYTYDMPKESLGKAVEVWTELLSRPAIPQTEMDRERHAVLEEINKDENSPVDKLINRLRAMLYPDHRLGWDILGPKSVIKNISRQDILRFVQQYYAPSNRAIIAVGDFDLPELLEKVKVEHEARPFDSQKTFLPLRPLKANTTSNEYLLKQDTESSTLFMGFKGPEADDHDYEKQLATLELLLTIAGGGKSSRLHSTLVEQEQLASSIEMGDMGSKQSSMLYLYAETEPEKLDDLKTRINEVLLDIANNGVTEAELSKAILMEKSELASATETQSSLMYRLTTLVSHGRLENELGNRLALYQKITPDDIQQAAKRFLDPSSAKIAAMVPKTYDKKKSADTPKLLFSGALSAKETAQTLPGGTEVITRSKPGSLKTSLTVFIRGGQRLEKTPGSLTVVADLLQRATSHQSAAELSQWLEERGIAIGTDTKGDGLFLTIEGLSDFKKDMLGLMNDILRQDTFRAEDVAFIKRQLKASYQNKIDTSPMSVASEQLNQAMYPTAHPYGYSRSSRTLISGIETTTPESLAAAYQHILTQPNLTVTGVGDITLEELTDATQTMIEGLPTAKVIVPKPTNVEVPKSELLTTVKEGLSQAEILRAWPAPDFNSADSMPLMVIDTLLSGGITGRLFQSFREKAEKALAYTVTSKYGSNQAGGIFQFYIGTDPANIKTVLGMFQKEIDLLANTAVDGEELQKAKNMLKSSFLSSSQKTSNMSLYLANHRALNKDSHEEMLAKIDQVTPADIQRVAQKYLLAPSKTVVLAPKAGLEKNGLPINGSIEYTPE